MDIKEFLNKKYFQLQAEMGRRMTVSEFGHLFGAKQSTVSMWLSGERVPGGEHKKKIITRYGTEAIQAFGEDPSLYYLKENWDSFSPEKRRAILERAEQPENETKRTHQKRRTRPS